MRRAIVVLMSGQGQAVRDITSLLQVSAEYVWDVIHAFNERGFDALGPKWNGGEDHAAELTVRDLLTRTHYGTSVHTELRRRLVETLIGQQKWQACHTEIDTLAAELGNPALSREGAQRVLHNIGLKLVCSALGNASPESRALLQQLLQHNTHVSFPPAWSPRVSTERNLISSHWPPQPTTLGSQISKRAWRRLTPAPINTT
jgi:transposase